MQIICYEQPIQLENAADDFKNHRSYDLEKN